MGALLGRGGGGRGGVPSNQIKVTFIIFLPFNLVYFGIFVIFSCFT